MNAAKRFIATNDFGLIEDREISVIGAGVAGLAASCALAQHGARVTLFERAPSLRAFGAGLQLSPNGVAVLDALGLGAQIRQQGIISDGVRLVRGDSCVRLIDLDLPPVANRPFLLLHRADLISLLAARAERLGVRLSLGDAPMASQLSGLVVAAEGVHSHTRASLNGKQAPVFTKQVAWRAVISAVDHPNRAVIRVGAGKHLVSYPLSRGRLNLVGVEEREEWRDADWHKKGDPTDFARAFEQFKAPVSDWLAKVSEVGVWGLHLHPVARVWQNGHVVLIGDAAHPTLPFLAQGANLALEDAWILARTLAKAAPANAFARFEQLRRKRVARAIATANANAQNYHMPAGIKRFVLHNALRLGGRFAPRLVARRYDWLYKFDPCSV